MSVIVRGADHRAVVLDTAPEGMEVLDGGSGPAPSILQVTRTLTPAELRSLSKDIGITLVEAQGAGKVIVPTLVGFRFHYGGEKFALTPPETGWGQLVVGNLPPANHDAISPLLGLDLDKSSILEDDYDSFFPNVMSPDTQRNSASPTSEVFVCTGHELFLDGESDDNSNCPLVLVRRNGFPMAEVGNGTLKVIVQYSVVDVS